MGVCGETHATCDIPYALLLTVVRNYDGNEKLNYFKLLHILRGFSSLTNTSKRQNNDINAGFTYFYLTKFTLKLIVNASTVATCSSFFSCQFK